MSGHKNSMIDKRKSEGKKLKSIGIIPDGNRRYAEKNNISYKKSYQKGFEKGKDVLRWCRKHPTIENAVIYALSTENLSRSDEELEVLIDLYKENLEDLAESEEIHDHEINVKIIGREELIKPIEEQVKKVEKATEEYQNHKLRIAIGYGSRSELIDAVSRLKQKDKEINESNIESELYSDLNLDMVIRTGGYQRLSNFQLWQAAYAELYFTDKLWPEFDKEEFENSVNFYEDTKRKFGR